MAITGEYNLYKQNPYNFGSLTAQGGARGLKSEGYQQANAWANQGVPNTTPQVQGFGIPSTVDMEKASKVLEANLGVNNPYEAKKTQQGTGYFPMGDGEVHPVYDESEHKLEFFC